jgi:hypothetical protein
LNLLLPAYPPAFDPISLGESNLSLQRGELSKQLGLILSSVRRRQPSVHGELEGCDGLGEELTSARKAPADARPHSSAQFFSGEALGEVILKQPRIRLLARACTARG